MNGTRGVLEFLTEHEVSANGVKGSLRPLLQGTVEVLRAINEEIAMVICFRRKAIVLGVAVAVSAVSSHAFGSFRRNVTLRNTSSSKAYDISKYEYSNKAGEPPPFDAGPRKVSGTNVSFQTKPGFEPNGLKIVYEWRQSWAKEITQNIKARKGGTFRWTAYKFPSIISGLSADASLQGPVDHVVVCQNEWEPGNETFCLNPDNPDTFDCLVDTCVGEGGTPFTPTQEDRSVSVTFNVDGDENAGACCTPKMCDEVPEEECTGQVKFNGIGTVCSEACPNGIPTVTEWGLVVMVLLVLSAGTIVIVRRRAATA